MKRYKSIFKESNKFRVDDKVQLIVDIYEDTIRVKKGRKGVVVKLYSDSIAVQWLETYPTDEFDVIEVQDYEIKKI